MKPAAYACVLLAACLLGGCASSNSSDSPTTTPSPAESTPSASGTTASTRVGKGECLVCKMNADLACIDVDVDKNTPSYVYNGHTYYFCSNDCRKEFARNPQKYLSTK
jgi:YHS domain-containing protein